MTKPKKKHPLNPVNKNSGNIVLSEIPISYFSPQNILFLSFLTLLTFISYSNMLHFDFCWDDKGYIVENDYIKNLNWESFKKLFTVFYGGNYHPFTAISNAIEFKYWGLNTFPYHLNNLLLHIVNTFLIFFFIIKLTGHRITAYLSAIVFALHPMHVESVTWIAERKDVLYAFFFLSSSLSYLYFTSDKKSFYYILSFVLIIFSLFSKSAAACFPIVLLWVDLYKKRKLNLKTIVEKIPFFILSVIFGLVALKSQNKEGAIQDLTSLYSFIQRLLLPMYATVFYIWKYFIPVSLNFLHAYPELKGGALPLSYYLSPFLLIALAFVIYKSGKYRMISLFGISFFLITIALVLQILPVGGAVVAERYSYLPYLGFTLLIGEALYIKFGESPKFFRTFIMLLISVALLFSYLTWQRNKVWKNDMTLFDDALSKNPRLVTVWTNRGYTKSLMNDYTGALNDYTEAINIEPTFIRYLNRGQMKEKLNDFEGALSDYNSAINYQPNSAEALNLRGYMKYMIKDYLGAIDDYTQVVKINPTQWNTFNNRGVAKELMGDLQGALLDYSETIRLNPGYALGYNNRGIIKNKLQDKQGAINDYTEAIRFNPSFDQAYFNRGLILFNMADYSKAITDFTSAVTVNPQFAIAYYNRGICYYYQKKMTEACTDWKVSLSKGYSEAQKMIEGNCIN